MAIKKTRTKTGIVTGEDHGDYTIFKGVPYARPPVGQYRLLPPQEAAAWEGARDCTAWPSAGVQPVRCRPPQPEEKPVWTGSEDCLYVNIWTPAANEEEKLPVIFWIHGGGFLTGSSFGGHVDGAAYARRGVILVSVGYRLGALAFFGTEELKKRSGIHSCNFGLMDIIYALKWTHANIAAFGGDPDNICIAGQSSGAMTVKCLLGLKTVSGLYRHAIAESGGGIWDIDYVMTEGEKFSLCSEALHILGWTERDVLCRDALEVSAKLNEASKDLQIPRTSIAASLFHPYMDKILIHDYYGKILYRGGGSDADILCGTTREEWHNFSYQVKDGLKGYNTEFALSAGVSWAARYNELGKKPIYHYFFDHDVPGERGNPGHGAEMPFTFGVLDKIDRPWTEYDRSMAETAVDYWTSFAKNGAPAAEGRPAWPPFTKTQPVSMHFANDGIRAEALALSPRVREVVSFLLAHPGVISAPFEAAEPTED